MSEPRLEMDAKTSFFGRYFGKLVVWKTNLCHEKMRLSTHCICLLNYSIMIENALF